MLHLVELTTSWTKVAVIIYKIFVCLSQVIVIICRYKFWNIIIFIRGKRTIIHITLHFLPSQWTPLLSLSSCTSFLLGINVERDENSQAELLLALCILKFFTRLTLERFVSAQDNFIGRKQIIELRINP